MVYKMQNYSPNVFQNLDNIFTKEIWCPYCTICNTPNSLEKCSKIKYTVSVSYCLNNSSKPNIPKLNSLQKQSYVLFIYRSAGVTTSGCRASLLGQDWLDLFQFIVWGSSSAFLLILLGSVISCASISHGQSYEHQRQAKLKPHKHISNLCSYHLHSYSINQSNMAKSKFREIYFSRKQINYSC